MALLKPSPVHPSHPAGSQATLSGVHPLECLYAPLSLILQSLALAWLAKVSEAQRPPHLHHQQHHHPLHHHLQQQQASSLDLYYTHLVNQSWVLGLLWLLHPDGPWRVLREGSWCCLLFHGYLLDLLLLGAGLRCAVCLTALRCSPLARGAALSGARGDGTRPLLSLVVLKRETASVLARTGMHACLQRFEDDFFFFVSCVTIDL